MSRPSERTTETAATVWPVISPASARSAVWAFVLTLACAVCPMGCSTTGSKADQYNLAPEVFVRRLRERAPELPDDLTRPPYEISREVIARARKRVMAAAPGPPRIEALVEFLSAPEPKGLGLRYDWAVSATAERTLELGQGNCFALASVLVGLGRGLDWPIYYAEARPRRPETHAFEEVTALSDHMVVIIVARTVRMIVDFTGLIEEGYGIRPIDDLTAYAHLINNVAGHRLTRLDGTPTEADWRRARDGFHLATRIQPELGRAWNNLGIAYTRLGRFEEARAAYHRALDLDTAFGSPERNLTLMETRATGSTTITQGGLEE